MFKNELLTYFRYLLAVLALGLSLGFSLGIQAAPANDQQLKDILDYVDELWRGKTSHATMTMTVKTRRYERAMTMESWSKGKDYSLIVIRKPKKDQNISTLKVKENIWNYLPKINRVTKVPSSMMSGSWMGSHFTNDDLVKDSSFVDEVTATFSTTNNWVKLDFENANWASAVYFDGTNSLDLYKSSTAILQDGANDTYYTSSPSYVGYECFFYGTGCE